MTSKITKTISHIMLIIPQKCKVGFYHMDKRDTEQILGFVRKEKMALRYLIKLQKFSGTCYLKRMLTYNNIFYG